jgi:prepilin-type N-terminal cleavage/methylation domain-containing protein
MRSRNRAFSLIELVIALAILAAVTTIALRATSHLQDQARYQSTARSLNEIQAAIVGPANPRGSQGSALVSGFVADTGRLPYYFVSNSDPLTQLSPPQPGDPLTELTYNPNSIPAYSLQTSNVDSSVYVGVGWQGPYVYLGAGPTYIRDGWGNSLQCYSENGTPITGNGTGTAYEIGQISSTPPNGQAPVYSPNSTLTTTANSGFVYAAAITGQVTMNVGTDTVPANTGTPLTTGPTPPNLTFTGIAATPIPTPPQTYTGVPVSIWVAYIGPDLSQTPNPVGTDPVLLDYNTETPTLTTQNTGAWNSPWTGQFTISANSVPAYSNVTIGPRVLKVYVLPSTVINASGSADATYFNYYISKATSSNYSIAVSYPIYATSTLNVTLVGGTQTINLALPHYSP